MDDRKPLLMTANFQSDLSILPAPQRRLWNELAAVPGEFFLYGVTALALHLGHPQSLEVLAKFLRAERISEC
jgi:hypothetical protein